MIETTETPQIVRATCGSLPTYNKFGTEEIDSNGDAYDVQMLIDTLNSEVVLLLQKSSGTFCNFHMKAKVGCISYIKVGLWRMDDFLPGKTLSSKYHA